ncbi:MAG: aminotransferase class I/II-fold pyridoxal phosphate-dependent enzyme [Acetivibrionales bacterium]
MNIETFNVERWMNTYENDAVYNLAETDAKPFTLAELLHIGDFEELKKQLLEIKLSYNPTTGSSKLREVIASLYDNTRPENVLVTTGAIEADFHITNSLVEPGDTVIVQFPAYQALYSTAKARGANVKYWHMKLENDFEPDLNELFELVDDKTKLMVLNIPHNPTGAVISKAQLKTILGWAEEKNFYVLCDEVYHEFKLNNGIIPPYGRSLSPNAVSVGSMSKAYGLSGLRLGWIVGPVDLVNKCWSWKDYTSISNAPINDFLASFALVNRPKVMERNLAIASKNFTTLVEWFKQHEQFFDYVVPKAGVLCFPKIRNLPVTSEELCKRIFYERKLLIVPGECFEMPGHLRIGFGNDSNMFETGLGILSDYIKHL